MDNNCSGQQFDEGMSIKKKEKDISEEESSSCKEYFCPKNFKQMEGQNKIFSQLFKQGPIFRLDSSFT